MPNDKIKVYNNKILHHLTDIFNQKEVPLVSRSRNLIKILAIIFLYETLIMIGLDIAQIDNQVTATAIDVTLLTFFSGISIWYWVFLPTAAVFEKKRKYSNELFSQIIEGISNISVIITTDEDGQITFANQNFFKLTDYAETEIIGQNVRILNSHYHLKEFFGQLWKTIKDGQIWTGEIKNLKKSGEEYWVKVFILPIDINHPQFICFQFDITEEKILHEVLTLEQLKNIQIDRLAVLGEMASGISHEINNPLAIINGYANSIENYFKKSKREPDEVAIIDKIEKIQINIKRITKIISALMEFSRDGSNNSIRENIKIEKLVEVIQDLNFEKMKDKGILFEKDLHDIQLNCNIVQIEDVLATLINNSVDAIQNQNEKWVKINTRINGDFIEINVTDSGKGIPEAIRLKIMQPFFTTKEVGKGTGLGLSIAKYVVENHGGKFYIDSTCENTRFVIRLPLNDNALLELINTEQAIDAHIAWRQKILGYLANKENLPEIAVVAAEDRCALGKWIKKTEAYFKKNPNFNELQVNHREFHICAAKIIKEIKMSKKTDSSFLIGPGTDFDQLSGKIISCLKKIKNNNHDVQI